MSYVNNLNPPSMANLQDVGLIMPADTLIDDTSVEFQSFAESIGTEWPPMDRYPSSHVYNGTKIICVRIKQRFTPEQIDSMILAFGLPWQCAYLASSYPIVDMGEGNQPAFEVLRPMVFEALLLYLEDKLDVEGNVIPYTLDDKLSLFAGAENTIRNMCGL